MHSQIFTTKMFCGEKSRDTRFLQKTGTARSFRIEGNDLFLEPTSGDAMRFLRVSRQN